MLVIYRYMNSYKSLYIVFLYHFIINTSTVSLFIINSSNKAHSRQSLIIKINFTNSQAFTSSRCCLFEMNDHFFPILSLFLCCVNNNQRIFFRSRIKETLTEPLRSQTTVESLTKLLSGIIVCCSSWGTLYPLINIQEKL